MIFRTPASALLIILLTLITIPAIAQVSVVGELSNDQEIAQGKSYQGVILVRNDTEEPQEAKVYQTDYSFHFSGTNSYGDPGLHPRSNASWIRINPTLLTIPPRSNVQINYEVTVPPDSAKTLAGTYWSMIMIEGIKRGSAESTAPTGEREMGVAQTLRYGVQISTTIAGTGNRNVRFIGVELKRREDGTVVLQADVENTGDRFMRPDFYVEAYDAGGKSHGRFPGPKFRMYPGTSVRVNIPLTGLATGTYRAILAVDGGGDDIFAAEYTLEL